MKRSAVVALLVAAVAVPAPWAAVAQTYPDRPLKVIVPVGPGGGFDFLARLVAPRLSEQLGQPVVVENRPGAGSLIGTEAVAKAPHDGYTLLIGGVTNIAANVGLYKSLPYDPLDFKPVSLSVNYPLCLLARKDLPQSGVKEVADFARSNPDKVTYGSAGVGSAQHVVGALLAHLTNTRMVHVPYKGAGAAQADLLAGRVDLFFNNCGVVKQYVTSGQMKLLAVSGRERTPAYPNVPTLIESGVDLQFDSWLGFFVGARSPQPVIDRLRTELAKAIASPDIAERLQRDGGQLMRLSPAESEAFVRAEIGKWRKLIPEAGIQPQ
jgi:tripartite-type tricarboxylate transporter receptor subunit TctC